MNIKKISENKDKTFKIGAIYLNIFSNTYQNNYVVVGFDIYNDYTATHVNNTFNINYELFDFIHKTAVTNSNENEFTVENKKEIIGLNDDSENNIMVYNDNFENSGIGVLSLYEAIFKVDYIDGDKWERFIHVLGLNENELIIDTDDINLDNHGIFNYDSCFKKNKTNSEINYKYIEKQIEFLSFSSIMASNSHTYELSNTKELIVSFISNFFRYNHSKTIKKCEHCEKWFIPDKRTTKYCDRVSPKYKNKNCKEAATLIKKLINEKSNEIKYLRKRVRMKYYNPVNNYGREKDIVRLEKFDNEDREWKIKLKNNETNITQYKKWLNSHFVKNQIKGVK